MDKVPCCIKRSIPLITSKLQWPNSMDWTEEWRLLERAQWWKVRIKKDDDIFDVKYLKGERRHYLKRCWAMANWSITIEYAFSSHGLLYLRLCLLSIDPKSDIYLFIFIEKPYIFHWRRSCCLAHTDSSQRCIGKDQNLTHWWVDSSLV